MELTLRWHFKEHNGVCEPSESIWVADAQVTVPDRIQMALTQMQTSEVAAAFVGEQANFWNRLHINSLEETLQVWMENTQHSDMNFTVEIELDDKQEAALDVLQWRGEKFQHVLQMSHISSSWRAGPNVLDR